MILICSVIHLMQDHSFTNILPCFLVFVSFYPSKTQCIDTSQLNQQRTLERRCAKKKKNRARNCILHENNNNYFYFSVSQCYSIEALIALHEFVILISLGFLYFPLRKFKKKILCNFITRHSFRQFIYVFILRVYLRTH